MRQSLFIAGLYHSFWWRRRQRPWWNPRVFTLLALLVAGLLAGGCSTTGNHAQGSGSKDPFEPFNRSMHTFNDQLDQKVVEPISSAYGTVTPRQFRKMIGNFVSNLGEPFVAANQLLQGKPVMALSDLGRFTVNSTVGIGGLFNPATEIGLEAHEEDLGQTFAVWGIGTGPYLVLPFIGPTTFRDLPSRTVLNWSKFRLLELADKEGYLFYLEALNVINHRADNDPLGRVREMSLDPYVFIREGYRKKRIHLIYDGDPPSEYLEDEYSLDIPYEDFDESAEEPLSEEEIDGDDSESVKSENDSGPQE